MKRDADLAQVSALSLRYSIFYYRKSGFGKEMIESDYKITCTGPKSRIHAHARAKL
jgi:hypothetical protein